MLVIGRITKDAIVNTLKDERQVVNFSIDYYRTKGATEATKFTTYFNCSYWISSKIAERLKKGTLVEVSGRIFVTTYADLNGTVNASLNCHVNSIKIHSYGKEVDIVGTPADISTEEKKDDLPF